MYCDDEAGGSAQKYKLYSRRPQQSERENRNSAEEGILNQFHLSFFWKFSQSRNTCIDALFGIVCVVMRAELRTAQTRGLANQSLGCIAESRLAKSATRLHRGGRRGQRHDYCCRAHILFTTGTQESLTLADRFSWKLCVSPIINRCRHIRV